MFCSQTNSPDALLAINERAPSCGDSRNHAAIEQLLGDRRGNAIHELLAHLRIFTQQTDEAVFHLLFLPRRRPASLGRKLRTG